MAKLEKPSTTKIAPPPKKQKTSPPDVTSKPAIESTKPIQVKVPASVHQEIKIYSAEQGMSMTDLFMAMYKEYRKNNG